MSDGTTLRPPEPLAPAFGESLADAGLATEATLAGLATEATLDDLAGTDGTGITQPTGGAGIRGWLSGIFQKLAGTLSVLPPADATGSGSLTAVGQAVTVAVPPGAA